MRIPLGKGDYERSFARAAALKFINRMYEQSPQNQTDQVALISRPGSTFEDQIGTGPIRTTFTSPGMFGGDLFVVSGSALFKKQAGLPAEQVEGDVVIVPGTRVRIAGVKGAGYERLFLSDEGNRLLVFQTTGEVGVGGSPPGDYTSTFSDVSPTQNFPGVIGIDNIYYQPSFQADVNGGSPDGTVAKPWRVSITVSVGPPHLVSVAEFMENLSKAIDDDGVDGTDYTTALVQNPRVTSTGFTTTSVTVANRVAGTPDPPIVVSSASLPSLFKWSDNPLAGGTGGEGGGGLGGGLSVVATPDSFNAVSVTDIASFVLMIKLGSQRVYFIRPGNTVIDALDFFEAEGDTDNLVDIVTSGDQVWLLGEKSIEPWFLSGSLDPIASPFEPAKGQAISIGVLPGTVVNHDGRIFFAGSDQNVYEIAGSLTQVSNPGISERIRRALKAQETF